MTSTGARPIGRLVLLRDDLPPETLLPVPRDLLTYPDPIQIQTMDR